MYIFEGLNKTASIVFVEDSLDNEDKIKGIKVDSLPAADTTEGKTAILMADKATETVWYEYIDTVNPITSKKIAYTKNEFYDIFTSTQFVAFMESQDVNIKYFKYRLNDFEEIRLDNPQTVTAITYLKDNGYITLEQYNSII